MSVQVNECRLAKSGKCYNVTLSGQKYLANLDSGLNAAIGMWIEAAITPSKDPKFPAWVGDWRFISTENPNAAPQVPPPTTQTPSAPAVAAPHEMKFAEPVKGNGDNIQPWYWPSVSNICAAAIAKGIISKPEDLNMWAVKWGQVCVATKEQVGL